MCHVIQPSIEIDIGLEIDLLISRSETADRGMGFAIKSGPAKEPSDV